MMYKNLLHKLFFYLLCFFLITSCNPESNKSQLEKSRDDFNFEKIWSVEFPDVAIYSSLRVADLNQDGVKDFVFGAGKSEMVPTEIGIIAVSGASGEIMWTLPARDEIFGSANFLDINNDGIPDVIIGGRGAILYAINGKTGEIIWEYSQENNLNDPGEEGLYNFYNPQFIEDQNDDGIPDILISNGGDVTIAPNDPNRPPGNLMIIDSKVGNLIAQAEVPDSKEIYMSIVVSKLHKDEMGYTVIFGTGGETLGGGLYRTTLSEIINQDLSNSVLLTSSENHGFVAPPLLIDLNDNGFLDIVANSAEGKIIAISGKDNSILWEKKVSNTEVYSTIAAGNFVDNNRVDLFTSYSIGKWPVLRDNLQLLIRGDSGEIISQDTLGIYQTASPVVTDFNNDGYDDALMSLNIHKKQSDGSSVLVNKLMVYDFFNNDIYQIHVSEPGANIASTPWIGDLDNNGKLDIAYPVLTLVYSQAQDDNVYFGVKGFRVNLLRSQIDLKSEIKWGSYMGSKYNGIYAN